MDKHREAKPPGDLVDPKTTPFYRRILGAVRSGEMPGYVIGIKTWVRQGDLDAWIERHRVPPRPASFEPASDRDEADAIIAANRANYTRNTWVTPAGRTAHDMEEGN